jgi:integrase
MAKLNAANERIKRSYFQYLKEAKRASEASVDAAAAAIARFEDYTKRRDFKRFHISQATGFKASLVDAISDRSGKPLAKATVHQTLAACRAFFLWLAGQPGYRSRLTYADADYFNLSEKDARVATASLERPVPTLEQIRHTLSVMPTETEIGRRNRAVVAFTLLTGARDDAIASARIKHVDLAEGRFRQDAKEVRTKFSKSFDSWFFPVGEEVAAILSDWVNELRRVHLRGDADPLFPASKVEVDPQTRRFAVVGLDRKVWSNAEPIRVIFREAFSAAGLPYFNPHSVRKTLARLGEQICNGPEEFKAWSQNLGHDHVATTFSSYGQVPSHRQAEILRGLGKPKAEGNALAEELAAFLSARGFTAPASPSA